MQLTPTELENMGELFNTIAQAQDMEPQDIIDLFNRALALIYKSKSAANKSREAVLRQAKASLDTALTNKPKKGEPFTWMWISPVGKLKDWNEGEINSIKSMINDGKLDKLMEFGQIMTMKDAAGKQIPVSEIIEKEEKAAWIKVDGSIVYEDPNDPKAKRFKEWIITKGKPWTRGSDEPIIRDARSIINGLLNGGYSKELHSRWQQEIVGIGFPTSLPDDVRLISFSIKGKQADPKSPDYFMRKYQPFQWYTQNFELDEKKSKAWKFVLSTSEIGAKPADFKVDEFDIWLENQLEGLFAKHGEEAITTKDFIPRVYFLNQLKDMFDYCVNRKDGNILTSDKGVSYSAWNKFGILSANVKIADNRNGNGYHFVFGDSSLPKPVNAFPEKNYVCYSLSMLPAMCLMAVTVSKKNTRYDPTTKQNVFDPEHGDYTITVNSIANTPDMDIPKLEIEPV